MGYSYRPRDPRAKLREVVARYVQSMRVAGRARGLHSPPTLVYTGE